MLCTYCGATASPLHGRCAICHTPFPPSFLESGTGPDSDPDADQTRLTEPTPAAVSTSDPGTADLTGIPLLQAGQTFAGRYTIIRLLGAGGMAAVYQAWDETLAAAVALKLIRIDPSMPAENIRQLQERFKRELKLARQVTHANVVRIHDLGEVGRTLYLTMAYVQGADLATVLQREGRLPIARALSLARQIVSGLAAAHHAGVVHRDLKPANIMVDADDHTLLTDFGIARSTTGDQALLTEVGIAHSPARSTLHTMPGAIMGTLEYMAPEQARGEPADERTDIYAIGLILYELVAGSRPRRNSQNLSDLIAQLEKGPPPLHTVAPDVPAEVERIISKCLKPDPAARYATTDELLADLETLDAEGHPLPVARRIPRWKIVSAAATLGAVLVTGTWWAASKRIPPVPAAARPPVPILIVDFDNRTQDAVFEGSLEQALSIAMEGAPFITAYPRKDAAALVQTLYGTTLDEKSARLLANREGIRVILAGAIERRGSEYRITVRAVDPDKPEPLKVTEASASDKDEVLGAIGRVAKPLRDALGDTTPSAQQQAETFTAASLEAVRAYTEAQDLAANQKDAEAEVKFREAIKHDPEFGRAYVGLANSLYYLGRLDDSKEAWKEALMRVDRMTEREKLRTNGTYLVGVGRDYARGIEMYEELVAKYPADSAGYNNLAVAYFSTLNFSKALEVGRKAIEIYPKSFKYRANYALYAMYATDFKTAATTAQQLIKEDPKFETAYLPLAMDALAAGDAARARAAYQEAAKAGDAGASLAAIGLADIDMYEGRYADAIVALPAAAKRDKDQGNVVGAVTKLMALGEAHAAQGQARASQTAISQARALSSDDNVVVPDARLAVAAGRLDQAKTIADLAQRLPAQSRAYAKLIEAEIAMATRQYPAAIDALNAARALADLWLVRYALALAYFHRGDYVAATAEFEKCQERRGQATAIFLDDLPTFRYYATVPYWLGRAREMRGLDPRTQYQEFLTIRSGAVQDSLASDARRRLDALRKVP